MEEITKSVSIRRSVLAALWQGALMLIGLTTVFIGIYAAVYSFSWGRAPHWIEAFRDRYRLANLVENARWPWIHQDTQYWIVRVRFEDIDMVTLASGRCPRVRRWFGTIDILCAGSRVRGYQNPARAAAGPFRTPIRVRGGRQPGCRLLRGAFRLPGYHYGDFRSPSRCGLLDDWHLR